MTAASQGEPTQKQVLERQQKLRDDIKEMLEDDDSPEARRIGLGINLETADEHELNDACSQLKQLPQPQPQPAKRSSSKRKKK